MANSFGALVTTGVLHEALAQTLTDIPLLRLFASDLGADPGYQHMPFNTAVTLKNWNANMSVQDFDQAVGYVVPDYTALTDQTFNLNKWKFAGFTLTPIEVNQILSGNPAAYAKVLQKLRRKMTNVLMKGIIADALAVFTVGNFPNATHKTVSAAGTFTRNTAVDIEKKLAARDALLEDRFLLLPPDPYAELEKDAPLISANTNENSNSMIALGGIRSLVAGFVPGRYTGTFPAAVDRGVAIQAPALVFAARPPDEEMLENDPVYREIITDPDTGFSIVYREHKNVTNGQVTRVLAVIYGFGLGLPDFAERITST